jgi:hypothetical protein
VEEIKGHRTNPATGAPEFLVKWRDWDPSDLQWLPWTDFFPSYNEDVVEYCAAHGIPLEVVGLLRPGPRSKGGRGH